MKKRMIVVIVLLIVLFTAIFGWKAFVNYKVHQFMASRGVPTITVSTAKVRSVKWATRIHSVASLVAIQGVTVTAQLPGVVTGIYFHSGQKIKAGNVLVQVNDGPQLAQLHYDIAQAAVAKSNWRRTRLLYHEKAASRADYDSANATYRSAKARVAGDYATLQELTLRAPFSGVLGIRAVDLGQYVAPGSAIVDLQALKTLYANFTVPQQQFPHIHMGQLVQLEVDAYPHTIFMGRIHALDSAVNTATRNILVQAAVPNVDDVLRPGMFANVRIISRRQHKVVVVPATALAYNTYGDIVYVVRHTTVKGHSLLIAHAVLVTTGRERKGEVVVRHGLKAGETVVTAGQVNLRNGMPVAINNTIRP